MAHSAESVGAMGYVKYVQESPHAFRVTARGIVMLKTNGRQEPETPPNAAVITFLLQYSRSFTPLGQTSHTALRRTLLNSGQQLMHCYITSPPIFVRAKAFRDLLAPSSRRTLLSTPSTRLVAARRTKRSQSRFD